MKRIFYVIAQMIHLVTIIGNKSLLYIPFFAACKFLQPIKGLKASRMRK